MAARCDCGLVFGGTSAFDKHRVGDFEKITRNGEVVKPSTRRCLTVEELPERGLVLSEGVWHSQTPFSKTPSVRIGSPKTFVPSPSPQRDDEILPAMRKPNRGLRRPA